MLMYLRLQAIGSSGVVQRNWETTASFFLTLQATPPAVRPRMGGVPPSPRDPPGVP